MAEDGLTEGRSLRRREFLIAGAATGIVAAGPLNQGAIARSLHTPVASEGKFAHGVSAGFPGTTSITLWTRLSGIDRTSLLNLEVAADPHFKHVVQHHQVKAVAGDDFTVHARIGGLKPGHEYHYRFETKHKHSRVGRFRTLPPADSNHEVKIGYYSCQSYEAGFFTPQAALAKEKDLDLVVCLGDYIYEHHYYDGPTARKDKTGKNHDGDVQTLAEFRQKYRFYQTDPNLQALHAAYPFVSVWDDHEVEDNYAGKHPDSKETNPNLENNGVTHRRVPFGARRKNGYKAFFEAMPRVKPKQNIIYGSVRIGNLVELFLTDQRQYRDEQPCADVQQTYCADNDNPGRKFLGDKQKAWFKHAVPASKAKWKLWGSEVMVMSLDVGPGTHGNLDQWDGYGAERKEVLGHFHSADVNNLVVLSGDLHTFVAGVLGTNGETVASAHEPAGDPVAVELLAGSATSFGLPEETGIPAAVLESIAAASDPHVKYVEFEARGYGVVTASKNQLLAEFKSTNTMNPHSAAVSLQKFKVTPGSPPTLHVL